jgi:hypothetical protein
MRYIQTVIILSKLYLYNLIRRKKLFIIKKVKIKFYIQLLNTTYLFLKVELLIIEN